VDFEMQHFQPHEFRCRCGCGKGFADMQPEFLFMLEKARAMADVPFIITSAFRCPEHNRAVDGAANSAHLRGQAVDIRIRNGQSAFIILKGLLAAGFVRIGYNQRYNFFHADNDLTLPNPLFFNY
jgi:zinc D-Ala-D-Ala carboxypeptidase